MPTPSKHQNSSYQIPVFKLKTKASKHAAAASPELSKVALKPATFDIGKKKAASKSRLKRHKLSSEFKKISRVEQINENVIENFQKAINNQVGISRGRL